MNVYVDDDGAIRVGGCGCCATTYRTREATIEIFGEEYLDEYPHRVLTADLLKDFLAHAEANADRIRKMLATA